MRWTLTSVLVGVVLAPGSAWAAPEETEAPASEAPASEAPATEAPDSEAPSTEPPPSDAPSSEPAAAEAPEGEAPTDAKAQRRSKWRARQADRMAGPPDGRAWMIGLEGVILQAPPLRTSVIHIDPRSVGRSVAMGGVGLFGRYRPIQFIGFDLGARTGSVRYRGNDSDNLVTQDQVLIDAGVMLFLGRGAVAQFALSGGLGGQYNRVGYELESGLKGTQTFGSALFRLGAEAEFIVKRVAFVLSFRSYGVLTDRDSAKGRGELLAGDVGARTLAPVATFQTYLLGSAGIAFRF